MLKALADRCRLRIASLVAQEGELRCMDIVARFSLTQATISHHLKVLTDAGVLTCRREGQSAFFSLDARAMDAFRAELGRLLSSGTAAAGAGGDSPTES